MSYQLKIIKDSPIGFWVLDEASGTIATDISGCGNNGVYEGGINNVIPPLTSGGNYGNKITNIKYITTPVLYDYYGSTASGGFGNKYTSDNDFTLEAWIHINISTTNLTTIFADPTNNVGLFWQNGNIIFKLDSETLNYTIPYFKKVLHIVAVYSVYQMIIYVDGKAVASKNLTGFTFTNTSLSLQIGPTAHSSDSFIVDDPAVYRYALSATKILNHYNDNGFLPPIQIAYPDNGQIFELYDNSISSQYKYSYPAERSWEYFLTDDLYYNRDDNAIEIAYSEDAISKTVYLTDLVTIPLGITMDSSKIEWYGDNGITVETSADNSTWVQCMNGQSIPQYKLNDFDTSGFVYLKITMSTTDNSKYLPKLYNLTLSFYNDQVMYAQNGGSYMSTFADLAGISDPAISLGSKKYPILSRDYRNGIRVPIDSGFYINANIPVNTIEFFYTPDALTNSGLITSISNNGYAASDVSWNGAGAISKTNINSLYVNGINKTSSTNVSDIFTAGDLHHVVITYSQAISGPIKFNYSLGGTVGCLIQNIGLYQDQFTSTQILNHYNLYLGKSSVVAQDSTITLTENSVQAYNNDWLVIQNV